MKQLLLILIILFSFARCNNDTGTDQQAASEQDSVSVIKATASLALTLAIGDVVNIQKISKRPAWVIQTRHSDGTYDSAVISYTDPVIPPPPPPPPPPDNKQPIIKTGPDQIITVNSAILNGSGSSDPDGDVITFKWVQEKGSAVTMVTAGAVANLSVIPVGDFRFRLTVTDPYGASNTDTVHIKRTGTTPPPTPPGNLPPVVNAGNPQTITLPASSVTLSGSATDADGTIVSYEWVKQSGTGGSITSPSSASTTVTGLVAGTYVFNLKATDNGGAVGNKTVSVTANAATPPPPAGYTLTFSSGYDALSDMLYGGNGQYGNGTISTTTYKTGPGSFYAIPADVSSGIRSEVQYTDAAQNPIEGAIEWDVMYAVVVSDNMCSIQWHPNTSGSSGSPYLAHEGGKFVWENWKEGGNTPHATGFTIQANRWYHMRVEYKFGSTGYWRHFIDGVQVVAWTGQVGDGSGQYLKVGTNGWMSTAAASRAYFDNLKVYKKN